MTTQPSESTKVKSIGYVLQSILDMNGGCTLDDVRNPKKWWCREMKYQISAKIILVSILSVVSFVAPGFASTSDAPVTINVSVKRFAYEPSQITLKKGEPVVIKLTTEDVAHGLKFKELNLNTKIEKGKTAELAFTPTQTGDFVGHCSVFCGSGHGSMTLTLHVTE